MIPRDQITEWRAHAPWATDAQVEQDLVISRALVEVFQVPRLAESLFFRGGTALYKLYLVPAARYSEDIDLVQVRAEPIGETLDSLRSVLDPWLGVPRRQLSEGRATLVYRFSSEHEPPVRMRLKVEINTREHLALRGTTKVPFSVDSSWFRGQADVATFTVDELLGTKLRALYQRKKGRDLFDLWYAMQSGRVDRLALIASFQRYMREGGHVVTRAQFEENLACKRAMPEFRRRRAVDPFGHPLGLRRRHGIGPRPGRPASRRPLEAVSGSPGVETAGRRLDGARGRGRPGADDRYRAFSVTRASRLERRRQGERGVRDREVPRSTRARRQAESERPASPIAAHRVSVRRMLSQDVRCSARRAGLGPRSR